MSKLSSPSGHPLASTRSLNPGGWIEVKDIRLPIEDNDTSFPEGCAVRKWTELSMEGDAKMGCPLNSAIKYKTQLEEAGFHNVREEIFRWPQNQWPKDAKLKELGKSSRPFRHLRANEIGMWMCENLTSGLSGLSKALFTRGLEWTPEETEAFLVTVRKDMKDTKIHGYYTM
jgi:hypothetical protein